jgi:peptidoglycan/xylan/chitin deacetylase (PgdA/CDA1 family)
MILTYHEIAPAATRYVYSIEARNLEEHLRMSRRTDPRLDVTFDDGHGSQYRYGLPLLRQYGLKAMFFITASWTNVRRGYMDWSQLAELVAGGHDVQSHGWSHRLLTACSDAELETELRRSRLP